MSSLKSAAGSEGSDRPQSETITGAAGSVHEVNVTPARRGRVGRAPMTSQGGHRGLLRCIPVVMVAVVALAATAPIWAPASAATASGTAAAGTPAVPSAAVGTPAVPPAGSAYLGGFVDPNGQALTSSDPTGGTAAIQPELTALTSLDQDLGRPLSIVQVSQGWQGSVPQSQLAQIFADGAIPMITWSCGDSDANVSSGADDAMISALARQLASSGMPIFLRWFADPNVSNTASNSCLGSAGPSGYTEAFDHIHSLFAAAGAHNVSFVWSVDTTDGTDTDWSSYYPGAADVGWIAADGYDQSTGAPSAGTVVDEFGSWYGQFAPIGKPLMISDTGAPASAQHAYIRQLVTEVPAKLPLVRAMVYFDAPDLATGIHYQFGTSGLFTFADVSHRPFLLPPRTATTTTAAANPDHVTSGAQVDLTPTVESSDGGGTVAFSDNGQPITGCGAVPLTQSSVCQTSSLPQGVSSVVATFSGDSTHGSSQSAPVDVTVGLATRASAATSSATGASSSAGSSSANQLQTGTIPRAPAIAAALGRKPNVPPAGSAYVGAFVDQQGSDNPLSGIGSLTSELNDLPGFNQLLTRPLSIVPVYQSWADPIEVTQLDQIIASGAIPMITWNCGDTDGDIVSGRNDDTEIISQEATILAQSAIPVLLRWFPDPNVEPADQNCLGTGTPSQQGAGYQQAFQYIHRLFVAAGANNVSFVWSLQTTGDINNDFASFYPGTNSVDWIAADADDPAGTTTPAEMESDIQSWYSTFKSDNTPMMLSQLAVRPGAQAAILQQLATDLPKMFPLIRGLVYLDTRIASTYYQLDAAGQLAFEALSKQEYFRPKLGRTQTTASVSPDPVGLDQDVHIMANVNTPDLGGYLTFRDNGALLTNCEAVPVNLASECDTSSLVPGTNDIEVSYSGDAISSPSELPGLDVFVSSTGTDSNQPAIPVPQGCTTPPCPSAYLGGWVRPQVVGVAETYGQAVDQELKDLPTLNAGLGRPLSVVHVYETWRHTASDKVLRSVLADGATPIIDWACGQSDASIIAGQDDAAISGYARQLAALKAPLFLRWYWEPNFPDSHDALACLGSLGPSGYVQAFRHIYDLFQAAGATNVSFVWAIGMAGGDRDWINYYPGSAYVGWIAADGYIRTTGGLSSSFEEKFDSWYATFAPYGKPMMVSETAAEAGQQGAFLNQIADEIPSYFPLLKGLMYFDAPGNGGQNTYPLGQQGMPEFQKLSQSPLFQPQRSATTLAISPSTTQADIGQPVILSATLSNTDLGGSLSFFSNGAPVARCQNIPIDLTTSCTMPEPSTGASNVSAVYSGDAQYSESLSHAVSIGVIPAVPRPPSTVRLPTLSFPPESAFLGLPTIGSVPGFGLPGFGGSLFSFPIMLRLPRFSDPSYPAGSSDSYPIGLGAAVSGGGGFGTAALPVCFALLACLIMYAAVTWTQDRRRSKKKVTPA
jgi:beta-mannanase